MDAIEEFVDAPVPPNDSCDNAEFLSLGGKAAASTYAATLEADVGVCGDTSNFSAPGIWYFVLGTGGPLIASTCQFSLACPTQRAGKTF